MEIRKDKLTMGDAVTSLMYASAVNIVLARAVETVNESSFIAILMILFIFLDWLTRIGVPLTFPQEDQEKRKNLAIQLLKSTFEIIGVFLLVVFFVSYLNIIEAPNSPLRVAPYYTFGLFLVISFAWNLTILYIMQGLSWRELAIFSVKGKVFDHPSVNEYTGTFKKSVTMSEENTMREITTSSENAKAIISYIRSVMVESIGRSVAQLLAYHVAWIPIVVGSLLLTDRYDTYFSVVREYWLIDSPLVTLLLLVAGPTVIYFALYWIHKANGQAHILIAPMFFVASIISISMLICFYGLFHSSEIVYVLAAQQVIVGLFLQFATSTSQDPQEPTERLAS